MIKSKLLLSGSRHQQIFTPFAWAIGISILANVIFLGLMVFTQGDSNVIAGRIKNAFEQGELVQEDYLYFDARRGFHQYNDCNVLQMIVNGGQSRIERALSPKIFNNNKEWINQCAVLYDLVVHNRKSETLIENRYSRYWHGYNALVAFALMFLEIRDLRLVLSFSIWCFIGVLAFVALRSGLQVRRAGLAITLTAAIFWVVPFFAPNFTHAPGDILILLGVIGIARLPERAFRMGIFIPYAAAFGSAITFFEMLTGQLPIAVAWLAVMTLAKMRDFKQVESVNASAVVLTVVVAFEMGVFVTIVTKQFLALLLADSNASDMFISQLGLYSRLPATERGWPGLLLPFERLVSRSRILVYGNRLVGYSLIVFLVLSWFTSAVLAWRRRLIQVGQDTLILAAIALIPVVWTLILPNHTYIHADFMVRILVIPISIAPLAWIWLLEMEKRWEGT